MCQQQRSVLPDFPLLGLRPQYNPHDASYLRLQNVNISYTFDLRKKTKNALRDITLSAVANNLYLWANYNGFDPDVSTESDGSTLRRVDMGAYPRSRTIVFSIQLRY